MLARDKHSSLFLGLGCGPNQGSFILYFSCFIAKQQQIPKHSSLFSRASTAKKKGFKTHGKK
jgi:hypothetical protein